MALFVLFHLFSKPPTVHKQWVEEAAMRSKDLRCRWLRYRRHRQLLLAIVCGGTAWKSSVRSGHCNNKINREHRREVFGVQLLHLPIRSSSRIADGTSFTDTLLRLEIDATVWLSQVQSLDYESPGNSTAQREIVGSSNKRHSLLQDVVLERITIKCTLNDMKIHLLDADAKLSAALLDEYCSKKVQCDRDWDQYFKAWKIKPFEDDWRATCIYNVMIEWIHKATDRF